MNPAFEKPANESGAPIVSPADLHAIQHPMSPPPAFSPAQSPPPMHPMQSYPQTQTPPVMAYSVQPKMEDGQQYFANQQSPPMHQMQPGQQYFPNQQTPPMHQMQSGQQYFPQQQQQQYLSSTPIASLNMSAAPVDCPRCQQRAMTNISHVAGNTAHAWAIGLCCFTGCLCFIPYMMNSMKDVQHRCGKCGTLLATWHKSGTVDVHAHA